MYIIIDSDFNDKVTVEECLDILSYLGIEYSEGSSAIDIVNREYYTELLDKFGFIYRDDCLEELINYAQKELNHVLGENYYTGTEILSILSMCLAKVCTEQDDVVLLKSLINSEEELSDKRDYYCSSIEYCAVVKNGDVYRYLTYDNSMNTLAVFMVDKDKKSVKLETSFLYEVGRD